MHRFSRIVWWAFGGSLVVALGLSTSVGCGDSGGVGGLANCVKADGCYDDTNCYTPTKKAVSFKSNVLPILEQSCSLSSSCHGDPNSPTTQAGYQPYLGEEHPETTPSNVDKILGLIVGVQSPTATNEKIVDPGKPESSFLMQKMDGTLSCPSVTCAFSACGTSMPQGVDPLPQETRDTVRDWIKQGAKNN